MHFLFSQATSRSDTEAIPVGTLKFITVLTTGVPTYELGPKKRIINIPTLLDE
jgi:hypothetical protein